jgi:hypothetical protein
MEHTITKNTMQLILSQKRQPVNTVLLVFAELCLDRNRYGVLFDFATIKKLSEELSLCFTPLQQLLREPRRIRQTSLEK